MAIVRQTSKRGMHVRPRRQGVSKTSVVPKASVVPKVKKSPVSVAKQDNVHPTYEEMVKTTIASLKERSGSSKQAILKYITGYYGITQDKKVVAFLRKALAKGIASGTLKQMTGTGATGSFKLNDKTEAKQKKSTSAPKKTDVAAKKSPSAAKSSVGRRKPAETAASAVKKSTKTADAHKPKKATPGTVAKTKPVPTKKSPAAVNPAPIKKNITTKSRTPK